MKYIQTQDRMTGGATGSKQVGTPARYVEKVMPWAGQGTSLRTRRELTLDSTTNWCSAGG